jgi:glycosyltransferase involved in cell wall biosynthesis
MKILHVLPGDLWAGAEAQVYYCLNRLRTKSDHDLTVILFNKGELYQRLTREGIRTFVIDERKCSSPSICRELIHFLREINPAVIHVHEYKSHILTTFAKGFSGQKGRVVRTLHGLTSPVKSGMASLKARLIFWVEQRCLMQKTNRIIAVSEEIEKILQRKFPREMVARIPNAIEFPRPILKPAQEVRREFNVGQGIFWIGTTARLVPVKNLEMLIEAARLLDHKIDYRISIFGEGPLKERLQRKISEYGLGEKVSLPGYYEDILPVFRALDVFTLTSHEEGLPISLLEAMGVGTVPVCTRVGGMKEVIEDEKTGFLVEPGNADALVDAFLFLHRNPEKRIRVAENARNKIRNVYSVDRSVDLLLNVYRSIEPKG